MASQVHLVTSAARAIGDALRGTSYAIVGGAALNLLGSNRFTHDVDVVVQKGGVAAARSKLAAHPQFSVDRRTRHTQYLMEGHEIQVDIIYPPMMFRMPFDDSTPTMTLPCGTVVLHPFQLLKAKLDTAVSRGDSKRVCDLEDVTFLLSWLRGHDQPGVRPSDLNEKDLEIATHLYSTLAEEQQELWRSFGFNSATGRFE